MIYWKNNVDNRAVISFNIISQKRFNVLQGRELEYKTENKRKLPKVLHIKSVKYLPTGPFPHKMSPGL